MIWRTHKFLNLQTKIDKHRQICDVIGSRLYEMEKNQPQQQNDDLNYSQAEIHYVFSIVDECEYKQRMIYYEEK